MDINSSMLASGHRSYEAALRGGDQGVQRCDVAQMRNQYLERQRVYQAVRMDGSRSGIAETSAQRAKQAAQLDCKQQKSKKCDLQAVFDCRKPGLFVH